MPKGCKRPTSAHHSRVGTKEVDHPLPQLRGRVGCSHHRADADLLTPPPKAMAPDAARRLEAIESLEDLGAGFTLKTQVGTAEAPRTPSLTCTKRKAPASPGGMIFVSRLSL